MRQPMTKEALGRTFKIVASLTLFWLVAMGCISLIMRDSSWWWTLIPGHVLAGFVFWRMLPMLRDKVQREEMFLALLIMGLVTNGVSRLW